MNANTLLADPAAIAIEKFVLHDDSITIVVRSIQPTAHCSLCEQPSSSLKTRYLRRLDDLPWHDIPIHIELHALRLVVFPIDPPVVNAHLQVSRFRSSKSEPRHNHLTAGGRFDRSLRRHDD